MVPLFLLGLLAALLIFLLTRKKAKPQPITVKDPNPELERGLIKALRGTNFEQYRNYWLAVSKMETANWTSNLFLNNKNPWGMKQPRVRNTTALPGTGTWAKYNSFEDAAKDILLWMNARKVSADARDLYGFIQAIKKVGYFEEPIEQYYNLVKVWKDR
jgi:hypothetical protein